MISKQTPGRSWQPAPGLCVEGPERASLNRILSDLRALDREASRIERYAMAAIIDTIEKGLREANE